MKFTKLLFVAVVLSLAGLQVGCMDDTCSSSLVTSENPDGCVTRDEWNALDETTPMVVTPQGATMAVGQTATFEVLRGRYPFTARVVGCLGGMRDCAATRLDVPTSAFPTPFTLVQRGSAGRTFSVTFVNGNLEPSNVRLEVWGSNNIGQEDLGSRVIVPIQLQ